MGPRGKGSDGKQATVAEEVVGHPDWTDPDWTRN